MLTEPSTATPRPCPRSRWSMRRIAAIVGFALALGLTASPAAHAAARLVVKGHGYGHGIGMSQYGALGYAQHGADYRTILGHYYDNTSVASLGSAADVRVLLQGG